MKIRPPAICMALLAITTAAGALLSTSSTALASPVPPGPNPALFGTWANTNPATSSVVDIVISPGGGGIRVDGYGACSPTPCQWGDIPGTVFGASVSSPSGNSFRADWNFGFAHTVLLGSLTRKFLFSELTVQEFTTFTDHSGRANYEVTETFVRARSAIVPTKVGIPAASYPLGDGVTPAGGLIGVWVNTSPAGGNIRRIILTHGPGGTLVVRAYGNCVPTLCAWGRVTATTFGTNVSSSYGGTFLASYLFGFKNALVDGTMTGKQLIVRTYSEFTDHSGRSNYVVADTFYRI